MTILVLDTRSGDVTSDLFVIHETGRRIKRVALGYVPELRYDAATNELIVADTRLGSWWRGATTYWLTSYDMSNWGIRWRRQTPARPMYTGYPGRSASVDISPSGRYVYFLQSRTLFRSMTDQNADDTFRLTVHRYDRERSCFDSGLSAVDSCAVAFGHAGSREDELYFHLSCDYPSTVAFGAFGSPAIEWVPMEVLASRDHSPRETCGSWLDARRETLYCVAGDGTIYEVRRGPGRSRVFMTLDLRDGEMIPLRQVHGAGQFLYVAVSADPLERSLSLASTICRVSIADARVTGRIELPFPVLNFVADASAGVIAGVSPYHRAVCLLDARTGQVLRLIENIGVTPAEALIVEQSA